MTNLERRNFIQSAGLLAGAAAATSNAVKLYDRYSRES